MLRLVRWWPSVYLDVQQLQPGMNQRRKNRQAFHQGLAALHLHWQFRVTEARIPYGFTLEAWGDFVGRCVDV